MSPLQYKLLKPLEGQSMRQFNEVRVNKEMQEMRRAIIELQNLFLDSIKDDDHHHADFVAQV